MASEMVSKTTFLTLPIGIRYEIYDKLLPRGYIVAVGWMPRTTLSSLLAPLRVCKQIHDEIHAYLDKKPMTLYCGRGSRPSIIQRVPRSVLDKARIAVIEDSPTNILYLPLVPSLHTICFCDVYIYPFGRDHHHNSSSLVDSGASTTGNDKVDRRLVIPDDNQILKIHHKRWRRLRFCHSWIQRVWKDREDIQVVLRRVMEVEKEIETVSYHTVVDVKSRSILAKSQLPPYANGASDDDMLYDYGNSRWWRHPSSDTEEEILESMRHLFEGNPWKGILDDFSW